MRTPEMLHGYQQVARQHIVNHPHSMLWLDMGLGKTISTLTAIMDLRDRLEVWGVLIVAPLRVCQSVWRQEAAKWSHTKDLTFSVITGDKKQRERALFTRADIYVVNYDNLGWLMVELEARWLSKGKYLPFNMIVWDEVSKLKNTRVQQGVNRGKAALKMLPYVHRRVGLTGTPASNGLLDLFGQYLVTDGGQRLGSSFDSYQRAYFYKTDWNGYRWAPFPGSDEAIKSRIGDITITMSNRDYLQLPELITNDIRIELPPKLAKQYADMEKEFLLAFDSGHELEIFNEASLANRCLQFANGACYLAPGSPDWEKIHDLKLDALDDIVEESGGQPILVFYEFVHDAERIMKKYPDAVRIDSRLSEADFNQALNDWKEGKLRMIIGHPASMAHGIDGLQEGGHICVWYGLTWSLDYYDQAIARLLRQGQTLPVIMHRIIMQNTLDNAVELALQAKAADEGSIRNAVAQYSRGER